MREIVIASGARTAIGDFGGSLSSFSAVSLGGVAGRAAVSRAGLEPADIEEVLVGHCLQGGAKGNPARQVQKEIGIPWNAPAATINQQCASAMRSLEIACADIRLGKVDIALVGGIESTSSAPYYLLKARQGYRLFHGNDGPYDSLIYDGLNCAIMGYHMGVTAENLAARYQISREEQDELAYLGHQRAVTAIASGKFQDEIAAVEIKKRGKTVIFDIDEHPRADVTLESLSRLQAVFKKDGTVTAGNASGLNDGGAAVVVMEKGAAESRGIKPMARILSTASCGVHPEIMGIGPVYAIPRALKYAGLEMKDVDYFEINEAFAAQFLACNRELNISMDKINANGSGIALGHPTGQTGIRLIITAMYELLKRNQKIGCASLCAGGGPAMAVIFEML
ncbi:3-ketoacyl-coa thiolase [hydrocarbon metagenome]|uniref:3-ketoacyl-coa thiolase n=1 Tax=hydrocarbon metagenome TaxID=938273 RepID=A0A0W8E242_9ZZZZ